MGTLDKLLTKEEFLKSILSFRDKMGQKDLTGEQRRNLHKALTINYLNVEVGIADEVAPIYMATSDEYDRRMSMLGHHV